MVMTNQRFPNVLLEDYTKLEFLEKYLFGLSKDALKDDRLALIIVYAAAEMILDFLLERLCKHGSLISKQRIPFIGKAILLSEIGLIDNELFNNLNVIKDLRNKVAHRPADNIIWQGKFAFDKKALIYKAYAQEYGESQDLLTNSLFVLHKLSAVGQGTFIKEHFDKLKRQTQQIRENNK